MAPYPPMLLSRAVCAPTGSDWVLEPKWDGYRFLWQLSDGGVGCWTRHGKRHDGKLPYIEEELGRLLPEGTVVDGELVALGRSDDGVVRHDFSRLGKVLGSRETHSPNAASPPLHYVVFDVLKLGGRDLRRRPWAERRAALESHLDSPSEAISLTDTFEPSDDVHRHLVASGFEGSVYKRRTSSYACGRRSSAWLKRKARHELEVVIRRLGKSGETVERASCALPGEGGDLVPVGYAEVWSPGLREALSSAPGGARYRRGTVCFSSVSARGELREARLTALT